MEGIFCPDASNPSPPPPAAANKSRSSSDASYPTAVNRKDILRCSPNMAPDESKAWTNQKHNLYLHHLELSFVTQLRKSNSLLHEQLTSVKNASEKFKVMRNGCCQVSLGANLVCKFKRVGKNRHPPSAEIAGSMELWSRAKHRNSTISSGLATCSKDLLDLKREGTGQNFLDGVDQSTSKSKTALAESSLQDQVSSLLSDCSFSQTRGKVLKDNDSA